MNGEAIAVAPAAETSAPQNGRPPREDLVRAIPLELKRAEGNETEMPTMVLRLVPFNEWAEIDSVWEGRLLERFAPGSLAKTMKERRSRIKVLFDHGDDPNLGRKVLGPIARLEEEETHAVAEVPLFATDYNRELLPGLEAGEYGASVWFDIIREQFVSRPGRSAYNPEGLGERTVIEAKLKEFGPTAFPMYEGATATMRSQTDEVILRRLAEDPERLAQIAERSGISLAGIEVPADGEPEKTGMRSYKSAARYKRAVEFVSSASWAMHPAAIKTVTAILAERAAGHRLTPEEIRERLGVEEPTVEVEINAEGEEEPPQSPVAVIPVSGPIIPKASMFSQISGATSIQGLQAQFREALADDAVTAILFDVDSPGGSSELVEEMGAEILAARGQKPIVAVANTWAASAAYWIASATDELVVTPSGEVGSIGVWSSHEDWSKHDEMEGVDTTLVVSDKSPYKVERNPFEPLSEEAEAEMKRTNNVLMEKFLKAVAKGRGVTPKTVERDFGQGRMVMAEDAVEAGMADRVATFDETLARLEKAAGKAEPERSVATTPRESEPSAATTPEQRTEDEPERPAATTRSPRFHDREDWLQWIDKI